MSEKISKEPGVPKAASPETEPLRPEIIQAFTQMAPNAAAFFLASEKGDNGLDFRKVFKFLFDFRIFAALPEGNPRRLNLKKSQVDPSLVMFVENSDDKEEFYIGMFRILRRIGFDLGDCATFIMRDVSLEKSTGDFSELSKILARAKTAVESEEGLPPVTRKIRFDTTPKN